MPVFTDLSPKQQGTSLADMINMARGIQEYQQAQQINPLLLRQQTAATNLAEQTLQPKIEQQLATTGQAKTAEKKAEFDFDTAQTQAMYNLAGGVLNDPNLKDPTKVMDVLNQAKERAKNLIKSDPKSAEKVDAVFNPLLQFAKDKPQYVPQVLTNIVQSGLGASGQQALQTPQVGTFGGQPGTFTPGTGQVNPMQFPGQQPQGTLPYPVRQAGMPFAASPSEEADRARNQIYRQNLVNKQSEFPTLKRNLDEVIKVATDLDPSSIWSAGTLGALNRKFKDITGDPTYKQLSKDLANVAISNIQAVGGSMDTVAGQQLTRMANGDETYPPAVLLNIARRTYADLTNVNMQAEAAQKFASKFGDNNLNAFRQEWNKNADSKVFEAISIYQNVQDPAERKKLIDGLLGSNQQTRKEFAEKYKNIKKLTETGEL